MPATLAASKPSAIARRAHEFTVEDVEYLSHGGSPLLLRLYKPKGGGPFPLMIDLHGGAWCAQDRTSDAMFNEALAKSGVVVAALGLPHAAGCRLSGVAGRHQLRPALAEGARRRAEGEGRPCRHDRHLQRRPSGRARGHAPPRQALRRNCARRPRRSRRHGTRLSLRCGR